MLLYPFKKCIAKISGKCNYQRLFEGMYRVSIRGMNIGGGSHTENSGEENALVHVKRRLSTASEIVVFDVGANIGKYTVLLNQVFGEKAHVYSFEPAHETYGKLSLNVSKLPNVHVYNFGFSDKSGTQQIYSDMTLSGLASVYKRRLDHFNIQMNRREKIKLRTIDSFCKKEKIENIHFLKLDVEGHELKVLAGAEKMLRSGKIEFVQFEFGSCNIDSRTFFQDFYYLLKDKYILYRIMKDGIYEIKEYSEILESFHTTNYIAELKR